jgi:S1-C subfamily serine protease
MTDGARHFTRLCPSCGRVVPKHVTTCRCGTELANEPLRETAPAEPAPQPAVIAPSPRRASPLPWIIVALLTAALAFVLYRSQTGTPKSDASVLSSAQPTATPAPAAPPARAPAAPPAGRGEAAPPLMPDPLGAAPTSVEDVVSRALPAVVSIRAGNVSGSGFFLTADTLVTNEHVVGGASFVTIRAANGTEFEGRVVMRQPAFDLATVKLVKPWAGHGVLSAGRVRDVRAGQEVLAIGSPLGVENTVTRGIVSGVRQIGTVTLLQTDAAINPGNSGGPLLNRNGLVIGITTLKLSRAEQMSFAVGIDHALPMLEGRQVAGAAPPLASILPGAPPDEAHPDAMRDRAEQMFGRVLQQAQLAANEFNDDFSRYSAACNSRLKWQHAFNPNDPSAAGEMARETTYNCRRQWNSLTDQANTLRTVLKAIDEKARQAGILPGVLREVFDRYGVGEMADVSVR